MKTLNDHKQLSLFENLEADEKNNSKVNNPSSSILKIFTDGASRGNPGLAAAGVVFFYDNKQIFAEGFFLGSSLTNNVAEFLALLIALQIFKVNFLSKFLVTEIQVFADSQLLVRQLNFVYKVKDAKLIPIFEKILSLVKDLGIKISFHHIPREQNFLADKMANLGIDKKMTLPTWLILE